MTVDDVLDEVLPDKGMYGQTGGGVTLSGGEPAVQPVFALALISALHAHGIQAALDTCGYAEKETFLSLCREAGLVLFDIKHVDNAAHKRLTGREFSLIERNFLLLKDESTSIQVRIPVIPGLNDDDETHRAMAALIRKNPRVESVLLLGYHPLGSAKGIGLGEKRSAFSAALPAKTRLMEMALTMAERTGIPCTFR
jgi:pyruvate formate lyase activating enzyme